MAWWVLAYFGDAKRGLLNRSREMEAVELRRWVWFGDWVDNG